jgi:hypothetical protein
MQGAMVFEETAPAIFLAYLFALNSIIAGESGLHWNPISHNMLAAKADSTD